MPWMLDKNRGSTFNGSFQYDIKVPEITEDRFREIFSPMASRPLQDMHLPNAAMLKRYFTRIYSHISEPLPIEILPIEITQTEGESSYPDYFNCLGLTLVSVRFKNLIESLEPNIHGYYPVVMTSLDGSQRKDELFVFKVGNKVSGGIRPEKSDLSEDVFEGNVRLYLAKTYPPRIMWNLSKIENKHLWFDPLYLKVFAVSDALYAELDAKHMTGFQAQEARAE